MVASASTPAGGTRCTCGHFPTDHMVVAPDLPGKVSGFHMAPTGPCRICGASACARYSSAAAPVRAGQP